MAGVRGLHAEQCKALLCMSQPEAVACQEEGAVLNCGYAYSQDHADRPVHA